MTKRIKFNSIQISDFLTVIESHGLGLSIDSDAQAGDMFSDLMFEMARSLDSEQADIYLSNV